MKKQLLSLSVLVCAVLLAGGCTKRIQNTEVYAQVAGHRVIAIIPPEVAINGIKKVNNGTIRELQQKESLNFQQRMYSWMLKGKIENRIFVSIQKLQETNDRLEAAGYFDDQPLTPSQMCDVLGVDAILVSNYLVKKVMTDAQAQNLGLAVWKAGVGAPRGMRGPTNKTAVNLQIFDKQTGRMVWDYSNRLNGDIKSTPATLVDDMMRMASQNSPYYYRRGKSI
ncbi:hypothetical protein [Telluribacter sp. SYSU D00476]|uniref:hypothetical protein n=1 Tax=Telluribacter sp. SYSU D00476 TaxID=2811430 RepID=UPI001FF25065|nr:hypothetical protein [Telluribacter sp. SYSU D00476]